jgi:iron complex transport system ATP-binding protein
VSAAAQLPPTSGIQCLGLRVVMGDRLLVDGLDLDIRPGELLGILGRNGSGKTTTLHTIAGLRAPDDGSIVLNDRQVGDWPRREVARRMGLLLQHTDDPFPATVFETALAGRHPHVDFWQWEGAADFEAVRDALNSVGLDDLGERPVQTLSGGERRRLALATLLSQAPGIYLLDEPTNHLDPAYEQTIMRLLARLAADGRTVAASLHDVNLASRYCDRCLLLFGNGEWAAGPTDEVLTEDRLNRLYGVRMGRIDHGTDRFFFTD